MQYINHSSYLTSSSNDIKVISIGSFEIVNSYAPHFNWTNSTSWNSDSTLLASTGSNDVVRIHSNPLNEETGYDLGCKKIQHDLAQFSHKSANLLASCGSDKIVILWDAVGNCPFQAFEPLKSAPLCLSFTSNDKYLCVGCEVKKSPSNESIVIYDISKVANKKSMQALSLPNNNQNVVKIDTSNFSTQLLACCTSEGNLYGVDIETSITNIYAQEVNSNIVDMTFSHVNDLLMMGAHENGQITFYDIKEEKVINTINTHEKLSCIEQTKDGQNLVLGSKSGKLLFYDMRHMAEPIKTIKAHPGAVRCISIDNRFVNFEHLSGNEQMNHCNVDNLNTFPPSQSTRSSNDYHFNQAIPSSISSPSNISIHSDKALEFYKASNPSANKTYQLPQKSLSSLIPSLIVSDKLNTLTNNSFSDSGKYLSDNFKEAPHTNMIRYPSDMDNFVDTDDMNKLGRTNFWNYLEKVIQNSVTTSITSSMDFMKEDIHRDIRSLQVDIISYLNKFKISKDKIKVLEKKISQLEDENKALKKHLSKLNCQD